MKKVSASNDRNLNGETHVWHVFVAPSSSVNGITQAIKGYENATAAVHFRTITDLVEDGAGSARSFRRTTALTLRSLRELAQRPPDVVHFHSLFRPPHAFLGLVCLLRKVPFVVSVHGACNPAALQRDERRKRLYLRFVDGPLVRRAFAVAALTRQEQQHVKQAIGQVGVTVVGNPIPPSDTSPRDSSDRNTLPDSVEPARTISSLGRFDVWGKRLDLVADIARRSPHITFRVYGERDEHNQPELFDALLKTCPPNLEFLAPVFGAQKMAMLANSDGFLLLSRSEGLSMALLESLQHKVLCFVSEAVAATLDTDDPAALVVVLSDNPEAAANELQNAVSEREKHRARIEMAEVFVQENYAPAIVGARLKDLYGRARGDTT